jgi:hypothetical protein
MSTKSEDDPKTTGNGSSIWQDNRVRRILLYAGVLLVVFLVGLVPMWLKYRTSSHELNAAQASLRVSNLQNTVANAAIDSRRGEYEPARQAASDFFTNLQAEIDRGNDSVFTEAQREVLRSMFATRDETITLLARSDPASADRLADLYTKYRQVIASVPQR